jgi:hypothetical protein
VGEPHERHSIRRPHPGLRKRLATKRGPARRADRSAGFSAFLHIARSERAGGARKVASPAALAAQRASAQSIAAIEVGSGVALQNSGNRDLERAVVLAARQQYA